MFINFRLSFKSRLFKIFWTFLISLIYNICFLLVSDRTVSTIWSVHLKWYGGIVVDFLLLYIEMTSLHKLPIFPLIHVGIMACRSLWFSCGCFVTNGVNLGAYLNKNIELITTLPWNDYLKHATFCHFYQAVVST